MEDMLIFTSSHSPPPPPTPAPTTILSTLLPTLLLLALLSLTSLYLFLSRPSPTSPPQKPISKNISYDAESNPKSFYPKLRRRKVALGIVFCVLSGVEVGIASWEGVVGRNWVEWSGELGMACYWLAAFVMVTLSFPLASAEVDRHWDYTVSLSVLTLAALSSTLFRLVVPSPISSNYASPEFILSTVTLLLQLLAFLVASTTPRCAPLIRYRPSITSSISPTSTPGTPVSALTSCSPLSYILFSWISPVIKDGSNKQQMEEGDLPSLGRNDRAEWLWEVIKTSAGVEKEAPGWCNALLWRIAKVNKRLFFWQSALALTNAFIYYMPAFFLQRLIAFLEVVPSPSHSPSSPSPSAPRDLRMGYAYCLGLFMSAVLDAAVAGQLWFVSNSQLATRIRVQLNCLVFDKTLKRKDVAGVSKPSNTGGQSDTSSSGSSESDDENDDDENGLFSDSSKMTFASKSQVLNLFSVDIDRFVFLLDSAAYFRNLVHKLTRSLFSHLDDFAIWCFSVIDAPAEIVIGTFFLYKLLGWAAFAGISVAVLFLPVNHYTSKAFASVQDRLMHARDKRVSLMNEVLQGVRMIKYLAYEAPFEARILAARDVELKHLRTNVLLEVSFNAIWSASPILCVLVSFYCYTVIMGKQLTPATAFASLAVWNELRFALNIIPDILVQAIQCLVSLRRIEKYLAAPEVTAIDNHAPASAIPAKPQPIAFQNATVGWPVTGAEKSKTPESGTMTPAPTFQLQDLTAAFPDGKLSLVCGSLGSGKTLLLLALLGEADVLAGQVVCPRSLPDAITLPNIDWDSLLTDDNWIQPNQTAFVPQSPWLQNASIRANICFGLPFREERYKATLVACSLVTDLEILEDGDSTEIGEKGINLSGGQKARVSLARAVYSRASIVLADDVLAAVDAHTAHHIFNECLKGKLMAGRTIVLVSHHVQLAAPGVDYVVELVNGRIQFEGPSEVFLKSDRFKSGEEEESVEDKLAAAKEAKSKPKPKPKALQDIVTESAAGSPYTSDTSEGEDTDMEEVAEVLEKKKPRKLIEDESRSVGHVKWDVWKTYLGMQGGVFFWIAFAAIFAGVKVADVAQTYWLNLWSASYSETAREPKPVTYYLTGYAILSLVGVLVSTLQWLVLYLGALQASTRLHKVLLHAILRAPLRFFDTQALGRIINRFSRDIENIDDKLPDDWGRSLMYGISVLTTLFVVATVAPAFLIGFAFLSIAYFHYAKLFSASAREFRRLDSTTKSPLYSIYGEAISGVTVIRAFGSSQRFMTLMLERCSTNVTYYWYLWSTNRWLSIRFSLLSALVVGLTGYILVAADGKIDAALAGFALTFSLNISNDMLFLVRRVTSLELSLVAVERVKEYSEIKPEAAEIVEPRPPAHWPHAGQIHVEKLSIRYAPELPDVLHELSFVVPAGSKVGIVGATGCGKSTLALSFFRFVEAHSGRIMVDGLDIAKVGLKDLRTNLTIIPQDPVILSGTLRSTLDIFNDFTDHEIFDALRRVHLIKPGQEEQILEDGANRSPFYNLDSDVSEGGENYSQGERQLLCMARALLRKNRVILLDEATASVDYETDEMISNTIATEFSDSTLMVIAHRLRTVIQFDRILLLDAGRIIEYDHPAKLLEDTSSKFYALCRASGRNEFRVLKRMAQGKQKQTHKPVKLVRKSSKKPVSVTPARDDE